MGIDTRSSAIPVLDEVRPVVVRQTHAADIAYLRIAAVDPEKEMQEIGRNINNAIAGMRSRGQLQVLDA